ncbi:hypothetical protein D3C76_1577330 [compost metagenome]
MNNNAAAQLITGLYEAGVRHVSVSGGPASLNLNGAAFPGYIDVIQSGKQVYAPSRLLSSLIQGTPAWTRTNGKLTITDRLGKQTGFTLAAKTVKLVDGESYLELHEFQKKFPKLTWSYKQGILNLSIN